MSYPPGEEDEWALGYDELPGTDVPHRHHPAPLPRQTLLPIHPQILRSSDPHSDHVMLGVDILSRLCERGACTLTLRCFGFLLCAMPLCCAVSGHGVGMNDDENFFLFHIPFRILFIFSFHLILSVT